MSCTLSFVWERSWWRNFFTFAASSVRFPPSPTKYPFRWTSLMQIAQLQAYPRHCLSRFRHRSRLRPRFNPLLRHGNCSLVSFDSCLLHPRWTFQGTFDKMAKRWAWIEKFDAISFIPSITVHPFAGLFRILHQMSRNADGKQVLITVSKKVQREAEGTFQVVRRLRLIKKTSNNDVIWNAIKYDIRSCSV